MIFHLLKKDLWDVHYDRLKEEVLSLDPAVETVNLKDITPFEWDTAYSFAPYTSKETIYETVGYKWDYISETVNEGMNQIVFLKDGKVVCYVYGYPQNNGFGIEFLSYNAVGGNFASAINVEDDLTFHVTSKDDVIFLTKDSN